MHPGSKVYFIDMTIDKNHEEYKYERYMDLMLWNMMDGKIRTREELEGFITRNGFRVKHSMEVKTDTVIETEVI